MAQTPAARPVYTHAQLEQYLDHVEFPTGNRISLEDADTSRGAQFLQELIKHQLTHVPFENLDLHYSSTRTIVLDVDHLFQKIVERKNGRGGYCVENNTFFGTILRSFGFDVMPAGARVCSGANMTDDSQLDKIAYGPFTHAVNIVTIAGRKYFVDVGFGNRGPTDLIALEDGIEGRCTGDDSGGNLFELRRQHIPNSTHFNAEQLYWVYAVKFHTSMKYIPVYCFVETEFFPEDLQMINFYVSRSPTSFFTHAVVCSKFVVEEGKVVGDLTLFQKDLKVRRFGHQAFSVTFDTEEDRVDALEKYFGIKLSKAEIQGIRKTVVAIP